MARWTFAFDALDRVTEREAPGGKTFGWAYDEVSNQVRQTDADDGHTYYDFDPANKLSVIRDPFGGSFYFEYDAAGRLVSKQLPSGAVTYQGYDEAGRVSQVLHARSDNSVIGSYDTTRDSRGNPTRITDESGDYREFQYDSLSRLIAEKWYDVGDTLLDRKVYFYDAAYNRIREDFEGGPTVYYLYDARNAPTEIRDTDGNVTYLEYNAAGSLASETTDAGTAYYEWNAGKPGTATNFAGGGRRRGVSTPRSVAVPGFPLGEVSCMADADSSTRKDFLRLCAAGTLSAGTWISAARKGHGATQGGTTPMIPRQDLLDERSPQGLEVFQLTTEPDVPSSHLYMEAQVFTADSKRLVLHRSATAHGGSKSDPEHRYLLCDLEGGGALSPLTEETGVTGASVSPGDRYVYYFVDETEVNGGRLTLRRVRLDGTHRETIFVVDEPLPGTRFRPSGIYPLSTISSAGERIAISAFLGDGQTEEPPWGLMVFDIEKAAVELIIHGPSWCNMHPQYSRSKDADQRHDILIQENHGNVTDARGDTTQLVGGAGADIHVIRDDGTDFRDLPWGRDGIEGCQGHQCWRGRSEWAITSTYGTRGGCMVEGTPCEASGHLGAKSPGGRRNDLTRDYAKPDFYHFGTDIAGRRLISDAGPLDVRCTIHTMELRKAGEDPATGFRYLLCPRSSCESPAHTHPFLSPDGRLGFFNSNESGLLQAYMIRGL